MGNTVPSRNALDDILETIDRIQERGIAHIQALRADKRRRYLKVISKTKRIKDMEMLQCRQEAMEKKGDEYIYNIRMACDVFRYRAQWEFQNPGATDAALCQVQDWVTEERLLP